MTDERQSTFRQRLLAILVAGIGAATASAVSFAMAVYAAANPEPVPVVAAGETVDTGRWIVSFGEAWIGSAPPTGVDPPEPKDFLMIEFDLVNRSATSSHVSANLIAVDPPVPGLSEPVFHLARDGWIASPLNPDMPERMIVAWEWPGQRPVPDELRLTIGGQTYKRRDNLYGASAWFDSDPVAMVELSVSRNATEAAR